MYSRLQIDVTSINTNPIKYCCNTRKRLHFNVYYRHEDSFSSFHCLRQMLQKRLHFLANVDLKLPVLTVFSKVLVEKMIVAYLVRECFASCGSKKFIIASKCIIYGILTLPSLIHSLVQLCSDVEFVVVPSS